MINSRKGSKDVPHIEGTSFIVLTVLGVTAAAAFGLLLSNSYTFYGLMRGE